MDAGPADQHPIEWIVVPSRRGREAVNPPPPPRLEAHLLANPGQRGASKGKPILTLTRFPRQPCREFPDFCLHNKPADQRSRRRPSRNCSLWKLAVAFMKRGFRLDGKICSNRNECHGSSSSIRTSHGSGVATFLSTGRLWPAGPRCRPDSPSPDSHRSGAVPSRLELAR